MPISVIRTQIWFNKQKKKPCLFSNLWTYLLSGKHRSLISNIVRSSIAFANAFQTPFGSKPSKRGGAPDLHVSLPACIDPLPCLLRSPPPSCHTPPEPPFSGRHQGRSARGPLTPADGASRAAQSLAPSDGPPKAATLDLLFQVSFFCQPDF